MFWVLELVDLFEYLFPIVVVGKSRCEGTFESSCTGVFAWDIGIAKRVVVVVVE